MYQYQNVQFTETNAYSINNNQTSILNTSSNTIYTTINSINISKP